MQEVFKKCRFKAPGVLLNAPSAIITSFVKMGFVTEFDKKEKSSNTLVFVNSMKEFQAFFKKQIILIEPDSVLWIAYPKQSSGIKTDIHRDLAAAEAERFGYTTVTAVSIDETWSALRYRPIDRIGK